MQLDWQDLKINGCPALWRALKQIETTLTQQEQATAELQYLVSEELLTAQPGATVGTAGGCRGTGPRLADRTPASNAERQRRNVRPAGSKKGNHNHHR